MPPPLVSESPLIVAGFAVSVLGFVLIVSLIGSLVSAVVPHPSLPLTGISDLLAPDGTFIHPRAAERTKFCSAHNRAAPEAVI